MSARSKSVGPKAKAPVSRMRKALLAKVHIAKKELGLDDETYRDAVELVAAGKRSAGKLSDAQLQTLLDNFKARGWKGGTPKRAKTVGGKGYRTKSKRPTVRKIYVLWRILYQADIAREKRPDLFVRRQTKSETKPDGVLSPEFLTDGEAYSVIEALKVWIVREGLGAQLR